jgi:uncharacterized membrane protein YkgB
LSVIQRLVVLFGRADQRVVEVMASHGLGLLRISLGVVFIWFGLLKVIGVTPVADLVTAVISWVPAALSVPLVGIFEVVLGVGLVVGYSLRFTLLLLWLHLAGTFLLLLVRPDLTFQNGNPLFLTADGEFVIKNLVLISGGIAVGSTVRRQEKNLPYRPVGWRHRSDWAYPLSSSSERL